MPRLGQRFHKNQFNQNYRNFFCSTFWWKIKVTQTKRSRATDKIIRITTDGFCWFASLGFTGIFWHLKQFQIYLSFLCKTHTVFYTVLPGTLNGVVGLMIKFHLPPHELSWFSKIHSKSPIAFFLHSQRPFTKMPWLGQRFKKKSHLTKLIEIFLLYILV